MEITRFSEHDDEERIEAAYYSSATDNWKISNLSINGITVRNRESGEIVCSTQEQLLTNPVTNWKYQTQHFSERARGPHIYTCGKIEENVLIDGHVIVSPISPLKRTYIDIGGMATFVDGWYAFDTDIQVTSFGRDALIKAAIYCLDNNIDIGLFKDGVINNVKKIGSDDTFRYKKLIEIANSITDTDSLDGSEEIDNFLNSITVCVNYEEALV